MNKLYENFLFSLGKAINPKLFIENKTFYGKEAANKIHRDATVRNCKFVGDAK